MPFGESVEGLSHCGDESCAFEPAVQKYDFQDSSLRRVISDKPLPPKCLRKFKNFLRQLSRFVVGGAITSSCSLIEANRSRISVCFRASLSWSMSSVARKLSRLRFQTLLRKGSKEGAIRQKPKTNPRMTLSGFQQSVAQSMR